MTDRYGAPFVHLPHTEVTNAEEHAENNRYLNHLNNDAAANLWQILGGLTLTPASTPTFFSVVASNGMTLVSNHGVSITGFTGVVIESLFSGGIALTASMTGAVNITASAGDVIIFAHDSTSKAQVASDGDVELTPGGFLVLDNLPVVNPGGTGRVWNNGGVLNIT